MSIELHLAISPVHLANPNVKTPKLNTGNVLKENRQTSSHIVIVTKKGTSFV